MPDQASPRGTFRKIADVVKARIETDAGMTELPSVADLMSDHGISRGVALRAFAVLKEEGLAEPVPGGRWRVVREGQYEDRRPLAERLADVVITEKLSVGDTFPSASELSKIFGVARPTVSKALDKLQASGLLSEGKQGKPRTVRSLPERNEGRRS
ncbi:GntR family transcriptional regulator [Streptomyces sp. NBC_01317]|uniref:GntR family transcriptional regulator n=1 Tax=Streptomyces sp. NBC_01317 TaxID=2903822 RepID=UPI002E0DCFF1|nr:GntR family transcriptional regulator [Streptomyces sp. NBC_01317]